MELRPVITVYSVSETLLTCHLLYTRPCTYVQIVHNYDKVTGIVLYLYMRQQLSPSDVTFEQH